jgi:hypothetical protein
MNFFLTSVWLAGMTWLGHWIGENHYPDHVVGLTVAFFFLALILRFIPECADDGADFIVDIVD